MLPAPTGPELSCENSKHRTSAVMMRHARRPHPIIGADRSTSFRSGLTCGTGSPRGSGVAPYWRSVPDSGRPHPWPRRRSSTHRRTPCGVSRHAGQRRQPSRGLPFPDASFDAVLAFEVIEHVEDDAGLLGEIARVSRPGRVLILSTPVHATMWSPLDEACGHVRRDEPPTLFEKVRTAGFEIGGYSWTPAPSRLLTGIRARALQSSRRLSTAFVQALVFPIHAAGQRMFARVTWLAPAEPVPDGADDVMLWATKADRG